MANKCLFLFMCYLWDPLLEYFLGKEFIWSPDLNPPKRKGHSLSLDCSRLAVRLNVKLRNYVNSLKEKRKTGHDPSMPGIGECLLTLSAVIIHFKCLPRVPNTQLSAKQPLWPSSSSYTIACHFSGFLGFSCQTFTETTFIHIETFFFGGFSEDSGSWWNS